MDYVCTLFPFHMTWTQTLWKEEKTERDSAKAGVCHWQIVGRSNGEACWKEREGVGAGIAYITIWHTHQTICMRAESNLPHTQPRSLTLSLSLFLYTLSHVLSLSQTLTLVRTLSLYLRHTHKSLLSMRRICMRFTKTIAVISHSFLPTYLLFCFEYPLCQKLCYLS